MHTDTTSSPHDETPPGSGSGPLSPPRTITAVDPADLVSYVHHVIGHVPRASCVVITMARTGLRAVLRCDLPPRHPSASTQQLAAYATRVAQQCRADQEADGSLVLLFRDEDILNGGVRREGGSPPEANPATPMDLRLSAELSLALEQAGRDVVETWLVSAGRIWHLDCPDTSVCTAHGRHIGRGESSLVNAEFILEGSVVGDDPSDAVLPAPCAVPSLALTAAVERFDDRPDDVDLSWSWLTRWEDVVAGGPVPTTVTERAELIAGLQRAGLRDALMAAAAFTLPRAVSGLAWLHVLPTAVASCAEVTPTEANAVLVSSVLLARTTRRPDWARLGRLRRACTDLLPSAAGTPASALRSIAAWIEWARGRGSVGGALIDACRRDEPGYEFAVLVEDLVNEGVVAGWAADPSTAWSSTGRRIS